MEFLKRRKTRMFKNPQTLGYMSVIGGFIVHLSLGSIYTYGNMAPYIIQYMNNQTFHNGTINAGNSMWIFGLAVFGLGASMSLGGFVENKLGPAMTVLLGCWIMSFGVMITSITIKIHIALISISYGLVAGLGTGIAYGVSLAIPSEWFPRSKGLVSGIIVAGFGLGPMIFDFIQSAYINNDLTRVHLEDVAKVPVSFLIMGAIYAIMQLIGSALITRPSASQEQKVNSMDRVMSEMFSDDIAPSTEVNIFPHQLIYELDFWILWITYALNSVVAVLILSLHKVYGTSLNISDIRLVIASAAGAFCNGFGRILWGYFNDRIGYKILMSVLTMSLALMIGTFWVCAEVGDLYTKNESSRYVLYFVWVIVLHFLLSGNFSLFPSICVKTFGSKYFPGNYGMLFTAYSFSGILTSSLTTKLLEGTQRPSDYLSPFLIGCGFSVISSLITLFYRGRSLLYKDLNI